MKIYTTYFVDVNMDLTSEYIDKEKLKYVR